MQASTRFGATFAVRLALNIATTFNHGTADHGVQTSPQAQQKGDPGPEGRRACTAHCTTYAATLAGTQFALNSIAGLKTHPVPFVLGHSATGALHYPMDRSKKSGRMIKEIDKGITKVAGWFGVTDPPTLWGYWNDGGGAYEIDQSWHKTCLSWWAVSDAAIQSVLDEVRRR